MKITFLGTGTSQGVPVIACPCDVCHSEDKRDRRLRTSALVETDGGENLLIDVGPDFREQMLRERVSRLDGILITHAHRDHVGGLDDIRSFNYVQHRKMDIYGNATALEIIRRDYHYIFTEHEFPGLPEADLHLLSGKEPFSVATQKVVPIMGMHKDMPVLGYRISDLVYLTDCNHIEDEEVVKMDGCKVLVVGALRKEKHFSHFCLPEALELIERVAPKEAYLIHVSHQMGFHAEVEKELPPNVHLAYDGLKVEI